MNRYRPNSIFERNIFQSKNNGYIIFNNDLDIINIEEIKLILNKMTPFYSSKWNKLLNFSIATKIRNKKLYFDR